MGRLARYLGAPSAGEASQQVRPGSLVLDVRELPQAGPGAMPSRSCTWIYRAKRIRCGPRYALRARRAIVALPAFLRRAVLADYRERPQAVPPWLGQFSYAPWMVANLTLRRAHNAPVAAAPVPAHARGGGFPPAWDNVLIESPSLGYVVATHQRETRWSQGPPGAMACRAPSGPITCRCATVTRGPSALAFAVAGLERGARSRAV